MPSGEANTDTRRSANDPNGANPVLRRLARVIQVPEGSVSRWLRRSCSLYVLDIITNCAICRITMTTRNHTLQSSGAASLISLLRRCYLAVMAADIPLLCRCFAAVLPLLTARPEATKRPLLQKLTVPGQGPEFGAEQRSRRLRSPVEPAEPSDSASPARSALYEK
jgi:hypothetical protein